MPSYEVALILRRMTKPETAAVLKRAAQKIYNNSGYLFNIENLGERQLPYSISADGKRHRHGSYFLMKFDCSPVTIAELRTEYHRDVDILKSGFTKVLPEETYECTVDEELKPPAYRADVQKMIKEGRKRERKFEFKTGLEYNPFRM